jgi:hypothetical protein
VEEKYNNKTLTLHIIVRGNGTTGKLDITFMKAPGTAVEYARIDGTKRFIYALSPEALFHEKIVTYEDKFKRGANEIHDLYDLLLLKDSVKNPDRTLMKELRNLLSTVGNAPPQNEPELKNLILTGIAPGFSDIIRMLRGWLDENDK